MRFVCVAFSPYTTLIATGRYVGRKRIDIPIVNTSTAMADGLVKSVVLVARVRFNCIRALEVRCCAWINPGVGGHQVA